MTHAKLIEKAKQIDKKFIQNSAAEFEKEYLELQRYGKIQIKNTSFQYFLEPKQADTYSITEVKNINKFVQGIYEAEVREKIISYIDHKTVCIDVGAHHGLYTMMFSKLGKIVYAFEANSNNYRRLRNNINKNRIKNIEPQNALVSNDERTYTFLMSKNSFLSQIDYTNFLSDELREFEALVISKIDRSKERRWAAKLNKAVRNGTFLEFIDELYDYLLSHSVGISTPNLESILETINRYIRYHDRYICKSVDIESTTLDQALKHVTGDKFFMKIDIEGSEKLAIEGALNFITEKKPTLFVESTEIEEIEKILKKLKFTMQKIDFKSYFFCPKN